MLDLIDDTLFTLSKVPGLAFLETYLMQIRDKRTQFSQDTGDLEAKKQNALGGLKHLRDLPKNVKGSKKKR